MGLLLLGIISGGVCAAFALWMGAPWWAALLTYSIAGTVGTLLNAWWHAMHDASEQSDMPQHLQKAQNRNSD